jgi:hypothetical protein
MSGQISTFNSLCCVTTKQHRTDGTTVPCREFPPATPRLRCRGTLDAMNADGRNRVFTRSTELVIPDAHIISVISTTSIWGPPLFNRTLAPIFKWFQRIMETFHWGNEDQIVDPTCSAVWGHDSGAGRLISASSRAVVRAVHSTPARLRLAVPFATADMMGLFQVRHSQIEPPGLSGARRGDCRHGACLTVVAPGLLPKHSLRIYQGGRPAQSPGTLWALTWGETARESGSHHDDDHKDRISLGHVDTAIYYCSNPSDAGRVIAAAASAQAETRLVELPLAAILLVPDG